MPFEATASSSEAIVLLKQRLSGFESEEGRLSGLNYVPKSKDEVFITTTPKAGKCTEGEITSNLLWKAGQKLLTLHFNINKEQLGFSK